MLVTAFAREIKRLRTERGMTVRSMASALDRSVAYVAKIETMGEVPTPDFICDMARVLDVEPVDLLQLAKETRMSGVRQKIEREFNPVISAHAQTGMDNVSERHTDKGETPVATVVSLINMKGGVGKTTLAMQLAHTARKMNLRTLAVDLDPQSNLSQALMGPRAYVGHLKAKNPTVVQVFDDYVPSDATNGSPRLLDVDEIIVKKIGYHDNLDLIPSRLELSRTLKNPTGKERRLAKALARVRDRYDLVIVDCAPTESILTDAAYFASRYIIVPVKPEFMATIGLPLLARSLQEFRLENDDHEIEIAGLVFNHSSSYSSGPEGQQSITEVSKIAAKNGWHICKNQVRYSASYAKSAREGTALASTSYARWDVVKGFERLAKEIFDVIGIVEVAT